MRPLGVGDGTVVPAWKSIVVASGKEADLKIVFSLGDADPCPCRVRAAFVGGPEFVGERRAFYGVDEVCGALPFVGELEATTTVADFEAIEMGKITIRFKLLNVV